MRHQEFIEGKVKTLSQIEDVLIVSPPHQKKIAKGSDILQVVLDVGCGLEYSLVL
jgi:hypothetical protein